MNRVRYRGETFVVERNGEAIALIEPSSPKPGVTLREVIARLGQQALPGDGFAEDLEAVQNSQPRADEPTWHS